MQLAFSRRMYVDIVFEQKIASWLDQHVRAFEFFGGVPEVIVPDNLKSAVIRCAFGVDDELVLNRSYRELAHAYGFKIDPTPSRSPEKKAKLHNDSHIQLDYAFYSAPWRHTEKSSGCVLRPMRSRSSIKTRASVGTLG